ncbi:MAG: hypothetical protein LBC83_07170 [Oscillospiraceae bacterium]|jgi:uncharacterized membrane protein YcgQ (UPF0703/DUF1980 family)|nr:hypothetical protein [Oscillospiraceae bacterium]
MKRFLLPLLIVCLLLLASCAAGSEPEAGETIEQNNAAAGQVIEIKEKTFVTQTNDIYYNPEAYLGKTIKLEGLFREMTFDGDTYYTVFRYGPGCCNNDGEVAFEVRWPEGGEKPYAKMDDWVEAVGVLEKYEEQGNPYLRLSLLFLEVKDTPGLTTVTQ